MFLVKIFQILGGIIMAMRTKQEIVAEFGKNPQDSGSAEVQVAILTERINHLTGHLKFHFKDVH